eukprot:TRINITY_DN234_c0_g8_i1.p1 TRINITY_DN234_c0_g8~~TRINITY_DN234_c0_g8_i1.p1  ORF type:complete len:1272 (-),score=384.83 TRINITY_DN234_c0_g8_i1:132-3830(-)
MDIGVKVIPVSPPHPLEVDPWISTAFSIQRLFAYPIHRTVFVADPRSAQIITSFENPTADVVCCRWVPTPSHREVAMHPEMHHMPRLLVADTAGNVAMWDVYEGTRITTFHVKKKHITEMHVLDRLHVLILSKNGGLSLWNYSDGVMMWKKDIDSKVSYFAVRPGLESTCACVSPSGKIQIIDDLNTTTPPERIRDIQIRAHGDGETIVRSISINPTQSHVLYVVMDTEILLLDIELNVSVGSIATERVRSPFLCAHMSANDPKKILTLHRNLSVSVWERTPHPNVYHLLSVTPIVPHVHRSLKMDPLFAIGIVSHGIDRHEIGLVRGDGKVLFWRYTPNAKTSHSSWILESMISCVSDSVASFEASPDPNDPRLVVGTESGSIEIVDVAQNTVLRSFPVLNVPIMVVHWITKKSIIVAGCMKRGSFFSNLVRIVDLRTGVIIPIMGEKGRTADSPIRIVSVSPSKSHVFIAYQNRGAEIWSIRRHALLRSFQSIKAVAADWIHDIPRTRGTTNDPESTPPATSSSSSSSSSKTEEFSKEGPEEWIMLTSDDGILHFMALRGDVIMPKPPIRALTMSYSPIRTLSQKNGRIVAGDSSGVLWTWPLWTKKSRGSGTDNGGIQDVKFCPLVDPAHNNLILVHFHSGDFWIWDTESSKRVITSLNPQRETRALKVDWIGGLPVVLTTEGSLLVMDMELTRTSVRFDRRRLNKPISSPALLSMDESISFRMLLEHGTSDDHSLHNDTKLFDEEGGIDLAQHFDLMDPYTQSVVSNPSSKIPTRCLAVAEFFGEMESIRFWTLVEHAIHKFKSIDVISASQSGLSPLPSPMIQSTPLKDGGGAYQSASQSKPIVVESALHSIDDEEVTITDSSDGELPEQYGILRPSDRVLETFRWRVHEKEALVRRHRPDMFLEIARNRLWGQQREEAIGILLATTPKDPEFKANNLKACLIAASISPLFLEQTVKLASGNLIANDMIDSGVEMLVAIGKPYDACKCLQMYDRWKDAAELAKMSLPYDQMKSVMSKWADYLKRSGDVMGSIEVRLSILDFSGVSEELYTSHLIEYAAMFHRACDDEGISYRSRVEDEDACQHRVTEVNLQFGAMLHRLGLLSYAEYYLRRAGENGVAIADSLAKKREEELERRADAPVDVVEKDSLEVRIPDEEIDIDAQEEASYGGGDGGGEGEGGDADEKDKDMDMEAENATLDSKNEDGVDDFTAREEEDVLTLDDDDSLDGE